MSRESHEGAVFVVSAPSGAGKSTLIRRLLETVDGLGFCVSHTTRPRRDGEEEGRDYHFVGEERFEELREEGAFLESAEVHGRSYGTAHSEVQKIVEAGDDVLLDLDVQGAAALRLERPEAVLVFVLPPYFDELRRRLQGRGTEPPERERRLETAAREILQADRFDYVVVNEEVDVASQELQAIVTAERCRLKRRQHLVNSVKATFPGN